MKVSPENLMVSVLNTELISRVIKNQLDRANHEYRKPKYKLQVSKDSIIEVRGGYLGANTDCCYEVSTTQLIDGDISETLHIECVLWEREEIEKGGFSSKVKIRFSVVWSGKHIVEYYTEKEKVSLVEFMGSRFKYNPRIIKNTKELIKMVNDLNEWE